MNKIKNFGRMVKFEFVRLFRNKLVIVLLLLFALMLVFILSSTVGVSDTSNLFKVSIFSDGKDLSEISAMTVIEEKFDSDNFIMVDSVDEGKELVRKGKVLFFIEVKESSGKEFLTLHYDGYSNAAVVVKDKLINEKNAYSYETMIEFLEKYGISVNESYFEGINFESLNDADGWTSATVYVFGVSAGLGVLIMFGLAYSISRDSETSANKMLAYMPISPSVFLWSKIVAYLIIGLLEISVLILCGYLFFDITFASNIFLLILMSLLFVLSTIVLGIVFSSFKSQIATVLCSSAVILIPLIMLSMYMVEILILPIQMFLYLCPMTPFVELFHGMVFNGYIDWVSVVILCSQIIVYYILAVLLTHKNIKSR